MGLHLHSFLEWNYLLLLVAFCYFCLHPYKFIFKTSEMNDNNKKTSQIKTTSTPQPHLCLSCILISCLFTICCRLPGKALGSQTFPYLSYIIRKPNIPFSTLIGSYLTYLSRQILNYTLYVCSLFWSYVEPIVFGLLTHSDWIEWYWMWCCEKKATNCNIRPPILIIFFLHMVRKLCQTQTCECCLYWICCLWGKHFYH